MRYKSNGNQRDVSTATPSMESPSNLAAALLAAESSSSDRLWVRKQTLEALLHHCQRALETIPDSDDAAQSAPPADAAAVVEDPAEGSSSTEPSVADSEVDVLCDLLKPRVESASFLEMLGSIHTSACHAIPDDSSGWDVVCEKDLWEGAAKGDECSSDQEDYVLVRQEDIVEGIACFMAAYLLSLKHTKEITPNQLQEALSKTFSVKKKKGKLRKAWDGSKVIYNVASWGATAIGIYQNPALFKAASVAFWTSCRVISKLL